MSAKELAITLLGLLGTYCTPWPGGVERAEETMQQAAFAHTAVCRHEAAHGEGAPVHDRQARNTALLAGPVGSRVAH